MVLQVNASSDYYLIICMLIIIDFMNNNNVDTPHKLGTWLHLALYLPLHPTSHAVII